MKDFITSTGGTTRTKVSNLDEGAGSNAIWTSEKVNKLLADFENGLIDIKTVKNSPFKDNDPAWKKANLVFEYTPEEMAEIEKCKADPIYFANKYCQVMTENGIDIIRLRDYQEEIINSFKANRFNILMASRQIGKTIMSGVFIAWFLTFHADKNVLAVANVASTTKEVVDKIKSIFENLPFFLKPGCVSNNVLSMKFDNGCRLIGRTTTKNTGIGFTIHLLYIDEFAHINPAYLDFFYRAIYPTISSMTNSKVIITSTPNGMNRFYEIYMDAVEGNNTYTPLRVDWWQVPGRDDEWKKMTIANLGSEEDFNQEYGLQFFSSDKLLLASKDLKKIFNLRTEYVQPEWSQDLSFNGLLDEFMAHPNFAKLTPDDIRNDGNYYIFSVDTADGVGKDYSVINIFKFTTLPMKMLLSVKDFVKDETDIFGLVQVATFRTNTKDINQFCNALEKLTYSIFNPEKVRLLIELNHKGEYVLDRITNTDQFWPGQLIHSKHTEAMKGFKPGLKLTITNKAKYCERYKYISGTNRILPNEFRTIHELGSFGKSTNGTYRSQSGNDDLAITCVNTSAFFESPNFWEIANDELDRVDPAFLKLVHEQILDQAYLNLDTGFDFNELRALNTTPEITSSKIRSATDPESVSEYKKVLGYFYGNS
jgi:hypothetical protein